MIDEGYATGAVPLVFSEPVVSRVMDGVQRYIVDADEVESADAALAEQAEERGVTTDVHPAGFAAACLYKAGQEQE